MVIVHSLTAFQYHVIVAMYWQPVKLRSPLTLITTTLTVEYRRFAHGSTRAYLSYAASKVSSLDNNSIPERPANEQQRNMQKSKKR